MIRRAPRNFLSCDNQHDSHTLPRINPSIFKESLLFPPSHPALSSPADIAQSATMVRQIRPARVYKAVTEEMNNRLLERMETPEPPWYRVMYSVPPSETLTRPLPPQHRQPNPKNRKPKDLYKPQRLSYPEDRLRKTFYRDHPWELARPRVIIESDGKDYQTLDWSKGLRQRGVALSGEW